MSKPFHLFLSCCTVCISDDSSACRSGLKWGKSSKSRIKLCLLSFHLLWPNFVTMCCGICQATSSSQLRWVYFSGYSPSLLRLYVLQYIETLCLLFLWVYIFRYSMSPLGLVVLRCVEQNQACFSCGFTSGDMFWACCVMSHFGHSEHNLDSCQCQLWKSCPSCWAAA